MDFDHIVGWLGSIGVLITAVSAVFAYLSITNETFNRWWLKRLRNHTPSRFSLEASKYVAADEDPVVQSRVAKKDKYYRRISWFAHGLDLDRDMLAESASVGFRAALVGMVTIAPQRGDGERLIAISGAWRTQHLIWQILGAIHTLSIKNLLNEDERNMLIDVMKRLEQELTDQSGKSYATDVLKSLNKLKGASSTVRRAI